MFNHKGLLLIPQNVSLQYFIFSYPYSRYESSFQGNRLPPSTSKRGPSSQQPASVLGAAGTLCTCKAIALYMPGPPGCPGRRICTKASTPTKPDQPAEGGSHKLRVVEVSSIVTGKTGTCRGCCTSPKFQITSGDANHFPLPTHRASDIYTPKASTLKKLLTFQFYSLAYETHLFRQVKKIKRKLYFRETAMHVIELQSATYRVS